MNRSTVWLVFRWLCYAVLIGSVALVPRLDIDYFLGDFVLHETSEYTWIELFEAVILSLTCLMFVMAACLHHRSRDESLKTMAILLCGLFGCLLIREMDYFLDYQLFDGAWQTLVSIILIAMVSYAVIKRSVFGDGFSRFVHSNSAGLIAIGMLILVIFSRLFGKGDFWEALMGDHFFRPVKDVAEEGVELLGMVVIFIGSVEFLVTTLAQPFGEEASVQPDESP